MLLKRQEVSVAAIELRLEESMHEMKVLQDDAKIWQRAEVDDPGPRFKCEECLTMRRLPPGAPKPNPLKGIWRCYECSAKQLRIAAWRSPLEKLMATAKTTNILLLDSSDGAAHTSRPIITDDWYGRGNDFLLITVGRKMRVLLSWMVALQEGPSATWLDAARRLILEAYSYGGPNEPPTTLHQLRYEYMWELYTLGAALARDHQYGEAAAVWRENLELSQTESARNAEFERSTLHSMFNLAGALEGAGRFTEAIPVFRKAFARRRELLGPQDEDVLATMANFALCLQSARRFDEAEALQREELALCRERNGPEHDETLISLGNLASTLRARAAVGGGGRAAAEADAREALLLFRQRELIAARAHGADDPEVLRTRLERLEARQLLEGDSCAGAERELRHVVRKTRLLKTHSGGSATGARQPPASAALRASSHSGDGELESTRFELLADALSALAELLCSERRFAEAEVTFREVAALRRPARSAEHYGAALLAAHMHSALEGVSDVLLQQELTHGGEEWRGKLDEALGLERKALAVLEGAVEACDEAGLLDLAAARIGMAARLLERGRREDAEAASGLMALVERGYSEHINYDVDSEPPGAVLILQLTRALFALRQREVEGDEEGRIRALRALEQLAERAQDMFPAGANHHTAVWSRELLARVRAADAWCDGCVSAEV